MVALPPTFPSNPSPKVRAAVEFVKSHESAHSATMKEVKTAILAPELVHHVLPRSFGQPDRGKDETIEFSSQLLSLLPEMEATIHEVVESADAVVIHATANGKSITGVPYTNEYMFLFHFVASQDDDPDKLPQISILKEFVDTDFSKNFFSDEMERIAAAEK